MGQRRWKLGSVGDADTDAVVGGVLEARWQVRRKLSFIVAAARVLLVVALLVVVGLVLAPRAGLRVDDAEVPQGAAPDLTGPEAVVHEFLDLLDRGYVAAATDLVADDAAPLALPGLPFQFDTRRPEPPDVRATLGFYTALIDSDVTGCEVESASRVTCRARVDSSFARAVGIGGRVVPVTYIVDGGHIAGIVRDPAGAATLGDYCFWVRRHSPGTDAFDPACAPMGAAASASDHRRLAEEFVAAGRPGGAPPPWR